MGLFDGIARRKAQKQYDHDLVIRNGDLADWEEADERIDRMIEVVRDCVNGKVAEQFVDLIHDGQRLSRPRGRVGSRRP